ncbi:hypothetical protein [Mesorhizobium liriopis]|nr:hypothetical protein [Mesorhizobium liriopis]
MNAKAIALLIVVVLVFGFATYRYLADTNEAGPVPQQSVQE